MGRWQVKFKAWEKKITMNCQHSKTIASQINWIGLVTFSFPLTMLVYPTFLSQINRSLWRIPLGGTWLSLQAHSGVSFFLCNLTQHFPEFMIKLSKNHLSIYKKGSLQLVCYWWINQLELADGCVEAFRNFFNFSWHFWFIEVLLTLSVKVVIIKSTFPLSRAIFLVLSLFYL